MGAASRSSLGFVFISSSDLFFFFLLYRRQVALNQQHQRDLRVMGLLVGWIVIQADGWHGMEGQCSVVGVGSRERESEAHMILDELMHLVR